MHEDTDRCGAQPLSAPHWEVVMSEETVPGVRDPGSGVRAWFAPQTIRWAARGTEHIHALGRSTDL